MEAGDTPVLVHNCGNAPDFVQAAHRDIADEHVTTGRIFDSEGNPLGEEDGVHQLVSGSDRLSPSTNAHLHEAAANGDEAIPAIHRLGRYPQDTHVESKYAAWMRDSGTTEADVVINHPEGMCSDFHNCVDAVGAILPRNSVMRVWERGATEAREIWGRA
ncbi:DddA-like double-stranded DNA deaminase toxin [Streptomyces sp. NPDC050549]|uniref:DddA-like double-stranded DNA deaminase toxin n=1 Tax=Streptomyces sp. NPDC050549 TaxID=3155406 RepID=UPI00343B5DB5